MIFYDLDGVIRDLNYFHNPTCWNQTIFGKSFCEHIDNNLELLVKAPPTEYFDVIKKQCPITIITLQPDNWIENTNMWLWSHFYAPDITVHFVKSGEEKLSYLKEGDLLVEDSPNFSDYSKIILIDKVYNRDVVCDRRVKNPEELERIING